MSRAEQLPHGRHGLPRSFVVQNQRERILAAVADVTSAASYAEMTVEHIIAAAGVSRRTFYEQFRNKQDAFLAAYQEAAERLVSDVRRAYESHRGFVERIGAGLQTFLTLLAADPAFARMCIVEVMAAGPEAIERRNQAMKAFGAMIEENALALLDDTPPSGLVAETVVGGIYDVTYTRIRRGQVSELPRLAGGLLHSVLVAYVGPERAAAELELSSPAGPATAA